MRMVAVSDQGLGPFAPMARRWKLRKLPMGRPAKSTLTVRWAVMGRVSQGMASGLAISVTN